jgi:hypothetical protein
MLAYFCSGRGLFVKYLVVSLLSLSQSFPFSACGAGVQDEVDYDSTVVGVNRAAKHFQDQVEFSCEFAYSQISFKNWDDAWNSLSEPFTSYPSKLSKRGRYICQDIGAGVSHRNDLLLAIDGVSISVNVADGIFSLLPAPDVDEGFLTRQYNDPLLFSPLFYGGAQKGVLVAPIIENASESIKLNNSIIRLADGKFVVRQQVSAPNAPEASNSRGTLLEAITKRVGSRNEGNLDSYFVLIEIESSPMMDFNTSTILARCGLAESSTSLISATALLTNAEGPKSVARRSNE